MLLIGLHILRVFIWGARMARSPAVEERHGQEEKRTSAGSPSHQVMVPRVGPGGDLDEGTFHF